MFPEGASLISTGSLSGRRWSGSGNCSWRRRTPTKRRKAANRDFADAERLVRRHLAGELILSFVPGQEQRLWRTMTRTKQQLRRDRVRLQNQLEGFLEEVRIKLSSHVSDLLGLGS